MSRRILVLSASVGAGHLRAAQAMELALKQLEPEAHVRNLDVLELTSALFRRVYAKAYLDLVNLAPHALGYFYDLMDRPITGHESGDRLRVLVERLNLQKFMRFVRSESWDRIISTHFLPAEMLALLRKDGTINTPHMTATTDFETHRLWVNQPCDHYFTATDEAAAYLRHWGVPAADVSVTGIPIHPVFSEHKERAECLRRHELTGDRPIILQLTGGFGVGPVEKLYRSLLDIEMPLEIVLVTGRNENLKQQIDQIEPQSRHRVKVLGFTDKIDELMTVADVVLSKPGGLTTSEVLAKGAAMAIINPIPGQESRNSDFLLENGAAIKINNIGTLPYKLTQLLHDPEKLATMKRHAKRLGKPDAAFEIARRVLE